MMPIQKSFMRALTAFVILVATGACQQPGAAEFGWRHRSQTSSRTMIETNDTTYESGAAISIRFTNRTGRAIGYNLCRARLERLREGEWELVQQGLEEVCTAELRGLRPGQSASFAFRPYSSPREGQHRIRMDLHDPTGGPAMEALSNVFIIKITRLD